MEKLIKGANQARVHYDTLTRGAANKILTLEKVMPFHRFKFVESGKYIEEYYDTPDHLLADSGMILSKVQTKKKAYFKLDSPSLVQSYKNEQTYYVLPCAKGDKPFDHAISIADSITEAYGTQFKIDLIRILEVIKINKRVDMNTRTFELVSGTGFKAKVAIEDILYQNFETRRNVRREGATVTLYSEKEYLPDFIKFTDTIDKYIKELVPQRTLRYFILSKLTAEPIIKKDEKKKP